MYPETAVQKFFFLATVYQVSPIHSCFHFKFKYLNYTNEVMLYSEVKVLVYLVGL